MPLLAKNASVSLLRDKNLQGGEQANRTLEIDGHHSFYEYGTDEDLAFCVAYVLVIITGVIGNSLIVAAVKKHRFMQTTTNFLIANIAVADLITMAFCIPYQAVKFFHHPKGKLGKVICTLVTKNNFTSITLGVSILTLGLLAIERYHALLRPMQHRLRMSKETTLYAIGIIWVVSILDSLPLLIYTDFNEVTYRCVFTFNGRLYWILIGVAMFAVLVTICYCYFKVLKAIYYKQILGGNYPMPYRMESLRHKKRLVQLLLTLTIFFVLFFAPRMAYLFFSPIMAEHIDISLFKRLSFFLVICNSCVNPIICFFQSANYRSAFQSMLVRTHGGRRSFRIRIEPVQSQRAFQPQRGSTP